MAESDSAAFLRAWMPTPSARTEFQRSVTAVLQALSEKPFSESCAYWVTLRLRTYVQQDSSAGTHITRSSVRSIWEDHKEDFTIGFLGLQNHDWSLGDSEAWLIETITNNCIRSQRGLFRDVAKGFPSLSRFHAVRSVVWDLHQQIVDETLSDHRSGLTTHLQISPDAIATIRNCSRSVTREKRDLTESFQLYQQLVGQDQKTAPQQTNPVKPANMPLARKEIMRRIRSGGSAGEIDMGIQQTRQRVRGLFLDAGKSEASKHDIKSELRPLWSEGKPLDQAAKALDLNEYGPWFLNGMNPAINLKWYQVVEVAHIRSSLLSC